MLDQIATLAHCKAVPKSTLFDSIYSNIFFSTLSDNPIELYNPLRLQKKYGNIFAVDNAFMPVTYITTGAQEIAYIHKNHKNFVKKYKINKLFNKMFGQGILNSSGEAFDDRRKNLMPAFKMDNLKRYLISMQLSINDIIKLIQQDIAKQKKQHNLATIDLDKYSTLFTLDIASNVFFNKKLGNKIYRLTEIIDYMNSACRRNPYSLFRYTKFYYYTQELRNSVKELFLDDVSNTSSNDYHGIMYYLKNYQSNPEYKYKTEDEMLDEAITILTTGHETSANAVVFTLLLLCKNTDFLKLVLEEINNITSDILTYDDLKKCVFTKMAIDEALRLYPPVWFTLRYSLQQDIVNNYYIPANSYIYSNIFALHRNPEYWYKPNEFLPFRFSPENKPHIVQNSYLPFIMGPRTCLAANFASLETQLIIIKLLKNFAFSDTSKQNIELLPYITLRSYNGCKLQADIVK